MTKDQIMDSVNRWNAKFEFFSKSKRLEFYEVIRGFVIDDLSPFDALELLEKRSARDNDSLKYMYHDMATRMREGATFTQTVKLWVPHAEAVFISVGEISGNLESALTEMIEMLNVAGELTKSLWAAVKNPIVYTALCLGIIILISLMVAPRIAGVVNIATGGAVSVFFFAMTDFVSAYWWLMLTILIAVIAGVVVTLPWLSGTFRMQLDRVPPWSIYRRIKSAYFLIQVSAMMRSGITLKQAIAEIRRNSNAWGQWHCDRMMIAVRQGLNPGEILNSGMMPPDVGAEIMDFGQLSSFGKAIDRIGRTNVDRTVRKFNAFGVFMDFASRLGLFGFILLTVYGTFNVILATVATINF